MSKYVLLSLFNLDLITRWKMILRLLFGAIICIGFIIALRYMCLDWQKTWTFSFPSKQSNHSTRNSEAGSPLEIRPLAPSLFSRNSPEAACTSRFLERPLSGPFNISHCCHLLRLHGLRTFSHSRLKSGSEVVGILTDEKLAVQFFGERILFRTRTGVRYQDISMNPHSTGENHRDILLATFAETGIPLSTVLTTEDGTFTLHELLQDSVQNFDIKQEELPWTAVAYALYLAPQRAWTNRFSESFDFDGLAKALMDTSLLETSCAGVHILYALTIIWRADLSTRYLSPPIRKALKQYLQLKLEAAIRSQQENGYWAADWHSDANNRAETAGFVLRDGPKERLLVTGHLLEWLELLPTDLQVPMNVYRRAARWICTMEEELIRLKDFCPYVHAVIAVSRLIRTEGS